MALKNSSIDWSLAKVDWSLPVQQMIANQKAMADMYGSAVMSNAQLQKSALEHQEAGDKIQLGREQLGVQKELGQGELNIKQQMADLGYATLDETKRQNDVSNFLDMYKTDALIKNQEMGHVKDLLSLQLQADSSAKTLQSNNKQAAVENFMNLAKLGGADFAKAGLLDPNLPNGMRDYLQINLANALTGQKVAMQMGPKAVGIAAAAADPRFQLEKYKADLKTLDKLRETGQTGENILNTADQLMTTAREFDKTAVGGLGPGANAAKYWANLGSKLGFSDASKAAAAGGFIEREGNLAALAARKDMPGQMSDKDREFLIKTAASLTDSLPAFETKANAMKAVAQRLQTSSQFATAWMQKYGTLDGYQDQWTKYKNENRLFDDTGKPLQSDPTPYLDPNYTKPKASYSVDGQPVSAEQVELMAKKTNMTVDQIVSKYGLQKGQ